MLKLYLGRARTGKTARMMQQVKARIDAGQGGNYIIVPEQYSHEAEREAARICGDRLSLYAEVLSFTRLARNVALELGGSAKTYVDEGGRLLQMTLALDQVRPMLQVYGDAVRVPERMQQLADTLEELHREKVSAEMLTAAAEKADLGLRQKLQDLAVLRVALDAVEEKTGAAAADRLDTLAEQIPQSRMLRGATIFIDGFSDFTAQERDVIRELWNVADVKVLLTCDKTEGSEEIFELAAQTARLLKAAYIEDGFEPEEVVISAPETTDAPLAFLEKNLFGWTETTVSAGDTIHLVKAATPAQECELAAGEVLRLVRESGCRWRDVAIAVRGFEDYRSMLEDTFRQYGVPLYMSLKTDVLLRPLAVLCTAAYDLLADGWSYESVFSYLKTGLTGITPEECDELENYVYLWSLRGAAWTRETPWHQHPEKFDGKFTPEHEEKVRRIDALRRRVAAPLVHLQQHSDAATTARGQCQALADFWQELRLSEQLEERTAALEAAGERQTSAEYRQLWDKMVAALEQCVAVLGETTMDRDTFSRLFRRMLSGYSIGTIPVALDRVIAGDFNRMRRRHIRHLLVLGASDDRLPAVSAGAGIFTDQERDELRRLDVILPNGDDAMAREFNLIYNVFALPSESLWISCPTVAAAGGEARPSFLFERIAQLFGDVEPQRGDLRRARLSATEPALVLACAGDAAAQSGLSQAPELAAEMLQLQQRASAPLGQLSPEGVKALYHDTTYLTASRMDVFKKCQYRYFMQYGLKAAPRKVAAMETAEIGTFFHYLLEKVAHDAKELGGIGKISMEKVAELTDKYIEEYVTDVLQNFDEKSARDEYIFRRLTKEAHRVVADTARELAVSEFSPIAFELDFKKDEHLRSVTFGETAGLSGQVDRLDAWEHDGKTYIRIADYKSNGKKLEFDNIWYGLGMQMLLYLFALQRNGCKELEGKELVPAGVLYVPAKDPIYTAKNNLEDAELEKEKATKLKRNGLLLDDRSVLQAMEQGNTPVFLPVKIKDSKYAATYGSSLATAEQMQQLARHVERRLREAAEDIRAGAVEANPWYKSDRDNSCQYCDFAKACRFNYQQDAFATREKCSAKDFWERLAQQDPPEQEKTQAPENNAAEGGENA